MSTDYSPVGRYKNHSVQVILDSVNYIAETSFGASIGPDALSALRAAGTRKRYTSGELLFMEGEPDGNVLLVESGIVKVFVTAEQGKELILGIYGKGELLCEMSALGRQPKSASGRARRGGCVTEIRGDAFRAFVRRNPAAMTHVLSIVQLRLRRADQARLSYLSDDVSVRVVRTLLDWGSRYGISHSNGRIKILHFTRKELAQSVAASEKTVDDVLTSLSSEGLLKTGRQLFDLVDPSRLNSWILEKSRR
jgi:CRP/FNR family transcriptional regulator